MKKKRLKKPSEWRPRTGVHPGKIHKDKKSEYDRKTDRTRDLMKDLNDVWPE